MSTVFRDFTYASRHWSSYQRIQLAAGMAFSAVAPCLAGLAISRRNDDLILVNSTIAALVAIILGFFGYRRFGQFPGISAGSYIIPCFSISYVFAISIMFFFRIDYSRPLLIADFLLTLAWFTAMHFASRRYAQYLFAVIPSGQVGILRGLSGPQYHFHTVASPQEIDPRWNGLIADFRADLGDNWERLIAFCVMRGVPVYHVKSFVEQLTGRVDIEHLSENTLGSVNHHTYLQIRNVGERLLAAAALMLLIPFFVMISVAIRLETRGPALFSQPRIGFRGKSFTVLKFRTMYHSLSSSEEETASVSSRASAMTRPNDARITQVGRFLRSTRLDELPQILNILRGEMSWIGPRPEAIALSEWYEAELPFYHYRHIVRPGITGWAQVSQGHVTDVSEVKSKLQYDFYYIKNLSFWLDMLILFRTFRTVVTGQGAR
ncbi:MAG TPA: sugar transferase [Bryobacteraceae bacterium]|nr:sugar transferase [Bryobacteraceae bacterium]